MGLLKKVNLFISRYGYKGSIYHIYCYIITKIFYRHSRLIRLPIEIRGRKFIDLGNKLTTGKHCRIEAFVDENNYRSKNKVIEFGNNIIMNDSVHIAGYYSVKIGHNVLIASKVFISDHNHGKYSGIDTLSSPDVSPNNRPLSGKPIVIEDNVWLGEFVAVLPGVTIGKGSIIGTMSVVSKSIPENCIAVGSPARVIKKYDTVEKIWKTVK